MAEQSVGRSAPVGCPLWNVRCYLAAKDSELCVGGIGVFKGEYYNDESSTAEYYKQEEEGGMFWHTKDCCEVGEFA